MIERIHNYSGWITQDIVDRINQVIDAVNGVESKDNEPELLKEFCCDDFSMGVDVGFIRLDKRANLEPAGLWINFTDSLRGYEPYSVGYAINFCPFCGTELGDVEDLG